MLQLLSSSEPVFYGTVILFSLVLVLLVIPSIIHVANERSLFDDMEVERKDHKIGISRLGGVAIFCSFTITMLMFSRLADFHADNYLLTSAIILFAVGLKDDLSGVNPSTKFGMQFIIAGIMVVLSDVRLTSLYGVFGIYDLAYPLSVIFSIAVIMFVVNAFNLIDGIDGLAGATGMVINFSLGTMFALMEQTALACLAFSLVGATLAFLKFNLTPAKIFMGDTGSLLLGFVSVVLTIKFIELNKVGSGIVYFSSAPSIAVALLVGPLFDTIRVFILRTIKNGSPFAADRNHIHHRLLRLGLSHVNATFVLVVLNILIVSGTLLVRDFGNYAVISLIFLLCIIFNVGLTMMLRTKEGKKRFTFTNFL